MPRAEQLTAPAAHHGEGPVWSPGWGGLRWVDMLAGDILHLDGGTGTIGRWHVGDVAAAFRPRTGGGVVIATEREFVVAETAGGDVSSWGGVFTVHSSRFNDGACDPAGRFLCGTMAYDATIGAGVLYRVGPDRAVDVVLTDVTISNGLCWTADGAQAYYNDTPTGHVDMFDSDSAGGLSGRRHFAPVDGGDGHPDGLTVDVQGGVWVAIWGGGAVYHYAPSGRLEDVIEVPAVNVTACTFGGEHLDQLFITTSRQDDPDPGTTAGAVFAYRPGVTGFPVAPFAG